MESKDINELPNEFKLVKYDLYDNAFTRSQSDFYFGMIFDVDMEVGQKIKEELFRKGALIKITSEKDAKPKYYPAPPTFIYFLKGVKLATVRKYKKTIEDLEKIYYEKFCGRGSFLRYKQIFFTAKGPSFMGFALFMMKMFAEKEILVTMMDLDQEGYESFELVIGKDLTKKITLVLGEHNDTKSMKGFKDIKKIKKDILFRDRETIIDDKYLIHFLSLRDTRGDRIMNGYITNMKNDIIEAKKNFKELWKLSV